MSPAVQPIGEADLLAFVDGKLDAGRRAEVEQWLASHPERAAEIKVWERQNEAISALYNPVVHRPLPPRLEPNRIAQAAASRNWPAMAAAAVVLLGFGLGAGWMANDLVRPRPDPATLLIDTAVTAHALYVKENRHAVEVAATDRQHLLSWLSNRIETAIDAPDLSGEGFNLVGGRLLPAGLHPETRPAAQLMYENAAAERLTVYITAALPDKAKAYEFASVAGLDAFYWANSEITCTVIGDLPEARMKTVSSKVYQQLTRRPDYVPGGRT